MSTLDKMGEEPRALQIFRSSLEKFRARLWCAGESGDASPVVDQTWIPRPIQKENEMKTLIPVPGFKPIVVEEIARPRTRKRRKMSLPTAERHMQIVARRERLGYLTKSQVDAERRCIVVDWANAEQPATSFMWTRGRRVP